MHCEIVNVHTRSIEEIRQRTSRWGLHQVQLAPGQLDAWSLGIFMEGIDFGFRRVNLPMVEWGSSPTNRITFYLPEQAGWFRVSGVTDSSHCQMVSLGKIPVAMNLLQPGTFNGISVDRNLLGSGLDDAIFTDPDGSANLPVLRLKLACPEHKNRFQQVVTNHIARFQREPPCSTDELAAIRADLVESAKAYLQQLAGKGAGYQQIAADRKERILRKALHHIHDKPIQAVSMPSTVDAAATTYRNLQYIFQQKLGVSPKRYLLKVRMSAIRHALANGAISHAGIGELISSFGISNAGRFSGDYAQFFGELPQDTLGRAQRYKEDMPA